MARKPNQRSGTGQPCVGVDKGCCHLYYCNSDLSKNYYPVHKSLRPKEKQ